MDADQILEAVLGEIDQATGRLRGEIMLEEYEELAQQDTDLGRKAAAMVPRLRPIVEQLKKRSGP